MHLGVGYTVGFSDKVQIFVIHFFRIYTSYSDHKSKESCSKYQFQKEPTHFLSEGVSERIIHHFSGLIGGKTVEQYGLDFELTFLLKFLRLEFSASNKT